jgi:hypothetical protein
LEKDPILPDEFTMRVMSLAKEYNLSLVDVTQKLVLIFNMPKETKKDKAKQKPIKEKITKKEVCTLNLEEQCAT